jgi:hypothetical protein
MSLTGDEPDLELGASGEGVVLLQVRLYGLHIGMSTENAVRELQSQLGLDNDGVVNRETWEAILHQEQQVGIQYQYMSPYDALDQLLYDMQHGGQRDGWGNVDPDGQRFDTSGNQVATHEGQDGSHQPGQLSPDGQWRWDGSDWQAADGHGGSGSGGSAVGSEHVGKLSDDGQWRWDGSDWQAADGQHAGASDSYASNSEHVGKLSDDGQWRWDGGQWQAAGGADGHVGQISDDGQWRWDGSQWQAA